MISTGTSVETCVELVARGVAPSAQLAIVVAEADDQPVAPHRRLRCARGPVAQQRDAARRCRCPRRRAAAAGCADAAWMPTMTTWPCESTKPGSSVRPPRSTSCVGAGAWPSSPPASRRRRGCSRLAPRPPRRSDRRRPWSGSGRRCRSRRPSAPASAPRTCRRRRTARPGRGCPARTRLHGRTPRVSNHLGLHGFPFRSVRAVVSCNAPKGGFPAARSNALVPSASARVTSACDASASISSAPISTENGSERRWASSRSRLSHSATRPKMPGDSTSS